MSRPNFFLRTKLLPPRAVTEFLPRPRLNEKLQANLNAPMTMVAADAGCGKTTLIADFVRRQGRQSVWYQLDHTDADPFVFLGYIAHGIKNFAPAFGDAILPYLAEAADEFLRFPERAVDLLLNEILEKIEQPFILVLDDYHHIGRETVVHKLVDRLLQYSSDILHVVITTRDLPPLAIMRRRAQAAALVITRDDLLFTDEEVCELFRQTLKVELKDAEIAAYRERTHGWITALQLVRQVAEQELYAHGDGAAQPALDLRAVLNQSEKDIFDYFAEEVFARETADAQNLLLRLSLLESLPLDTCSILFPELRCAATLPELVQRNVFLTVAGDGKSDEEEYRLHPLFRDFLQRRLRAEIGRAALAAERNRIAEHYLAAQQWETALPYLFAAENYARAAELIAEKGGAWIAGGAITLLKDFIVKIPAEQLAAQPRALLHKAEIERLQGNADESLNLLQRAVKLLHAADDGGGEAEALHALAGLARRRGRCDDAFDYLAQAEKLVAADTETFLKCANTRGLCLIAQGAWTDAEQQLRYALELAEKQANAQYVRLITHNLALPAGYRGDFTEALRWLKRIFREDGNSKPLPQEAIGHLNVARLHQYRGELDETEKHLERALELCQLYNLKSLRGEIFEAYGNFYRDRDDAPHALEYYERARKAYEDAGINLAAHELDEERAKFYLAQGDAVKARGILEQAYAARVALNNEIGTRVTQLALARVRFALDRAADGLAEEVKELTEFFNAHSLHYDEATAALLSAQIYYARDNAKQMTPPLQRALDLTARYDYEHWLRGEIKRQPQMFADEDILDKLPQDLRAAARQGMKDEGEGLKNDPVESAPAHHSSLITHHSETVTDLTVKVMGFVEIYRDPAQPFAADAWTTRRARDIFCYLATSKHRRVEKETLIDAFWNADDLAAIEKNFHPTISHIRKALNSRQPFKQNFLVFRDGAYSLNPELIYAIDTEEFLAVIAAAETAKRAGNTEILRAELLKAHALYRGEFMAGVYDDWAEERRPFYAEQQGRVTSALARLAFTEREWASATKYANEMLQLDPYREDAHRLIMKIHAARGKRAAVKEHFEQLKTLLTKELGVTPSAQTRKTYEELLK